MLLITPARWLAPLVVLALAVAAPAAPPARAHAILVASSPAAGDRVASLDEVRLDFAHDLAREGHRVVVRSDAGEVAAAGYELAGAASLVARFDAPVPPGGHEVVWQAVGADGHRESGRFPVTVLAGAAAAGGGGGDGGPGTGAVAAAVVLAAAVAAVSAVAAWRAGPRRRAARSAR